MVLHLLYLPENLGLFCSDFIANEDTATDDGMLGIIVRFEGGYGTRFAIEDSEASGFRALHGRTLRFPAAAVSDLHSRPSDRFNIEDSESSGFRALQGRTLKVPAVTVADAAPSPLRSISIVGRPTSTGSSTSWGMVIYMPILVCNSLQCLAVGSILFGLVLNGIASADSFLPAASWPAYSSCC